MKETVNIIDRKDNIITKKIEITGENETELQKKKKDIENSIDLSKEYIDSKENKKELLID